MTRRGFTIIEVLVVILLISVLAVFMVPQYLERAEQAKCKAARAQIAIIEQHLSAFMMDCGRYPTQSESLQALQTAPAGLSGRWKGPYGKASDLIDPWGNPYTYTIPGTKNTNKFDISSYGTDGQMGGEGGNADITNT